MGRMTGRGDKCIKVMQACNQNQQLFVSLGEMKLYKNPETFGVFHLPWKARSE